MSVNRQCVADFEGLTTWRREDTVDLEKYSDMGMYTLFVLVAGYVAEELTNHLNSQRNRRV